MLPINCTNPQSKTGFYYVKPQTTYLLHNGIPRLFQYTPQTEI